MNNRDYYGGWFVLSGGIVSRVTTSDHSADGNFVAWVAEHLAPAIAAVPKIVRAAQSAALTFDAVIDKGIDNADYQNVAGELGEAIHGVPHQIDSADIYRCSPDSANAIAAIPALLQACERARRVCFAGTAGDVRKATRPTIAEARRELWQALARADRWRFGKHADSIH